MGWGGGLGGARTVTRALSSPTSTPLGVSTLTCTCWKKPGVTCGAAIESEGAGFSWCTAQGMHAPFQLVLGWVGIARSDVVAGSPCIGIARNVKRPALLRDFPCLCSTGGQSNRPMPASRFLDYHTKKFPRSLSFLPCDLYVFGSGILQGHNNNHVHYKRCLDSRGDASKHMRPKPRNPSISWTHCRCNY